MFLPKKLMKAISENDVRLIKWKLSVYPGVAKIKIDIPVLKTEFQFLYRQYAKYKNEAIKEMEFEEYVKSTRSVGIPPDTYNLFDRHIEGILKDHICNDINKLEIDSFKIKKIFYYGLDKGFEEVFFMRIEVEAYPTEEYYKRFG